MNTEEAMEIDFNAEFQKILSFLFWAEKENEMIGGYTAKEVVKSFGIITGHDMDGLRHIFVDED